MSMNGTKKGEKMSMNLPFIRFGSKLSMNTLLHPRPYQILTSASKAFSVCCAAADLQSRSPHFQASSADMCRSRNVHSGC